MATSINESVNWRNAAKTPDYQTAARQVDTFVRPETNGRGEQIAKALDQASGVFDKIATRKGAEARAAQAAVDEQVSDLERLNASTAGEFWKPHAEEFVRTYDFGLKDGKRPTQEQVWADFNTKHPEYLVALGNLQTFKGKVALQEVVGDMFNKTFSETSITRERLDEDNAIQNNLLIKLKNVSHASNTQDFLTWIRQADKDIMGFGRSPQEAYNTLANLASVAARENKDYRVYDYLLGNTPNGKAIGGDEEREKWGKELQSIKDKHATDKNKLHLETANALKVNQVKLAQEGAKLFNSDEPPTEKALLELTNKFIEAGVPNAANLVTTMQTNFGKLQSVTISTEEEADLWNGFFAAETPDRQREFINKKVEAGEISKGLMSQFYSRLGNDNDKTLLQASEYKVYSSSVSSLSQKSGPFQTLVEDTKFSYLKPLFQTRYLQMATSPEWATKDTEERAQAMKGLWIAMLEFKKLHDDDPKNDMEGLINLQQGKPLAGLVEPNAAALEQWKINKDKPDFLEKWDKKFTRPK